jgi:voltage-gated sodium channel
LFFSKVNEELWGDVSIAMLTLFRVATFEDWTDVMYETMTVYPLSWLFFLSFIFLAAFVFLNMMVGTILEVMTSEQNAHDVEEAKHEREEIVSALRKIQLQIDQLNQNIKTNQSPDRL